MLASPRTSLWTLAAFAAAAAGGCVEREMTIRSDPPGALVYVDDYDIGITPVTTPFTYYGQRQVRLVKDGYETLTLLQPVPPPWYEFYGLDFISENIVPGKIRDQRVFEYRLQPQVLSPPDQLRGRAETLRRGVQATALPPSAPGAPGMRINPPPGVAPPEMVPAPAPAGPAIGGQTVYPLQPGGR
ncbi:MAG: PEGA domain-containing protein [Thermoguttaceae bacterium]